MADVVAHDVADEEAGEEDTDDGIDEIEPVGASDGELVRQQVLYLLDKPFQQQTGQRREHADDQGQQEHELPVGDVRRAPLYELIKNG